MAGCLGRGFDPLCSMGADAPIEGISVSPSSVKPGEKITIKAKMHGIGAWYIACGNFMVEFYFNYVGIGCYEDRITKGQYWWISFDYIIPEGTPAGVYHVGAKELLSTTQRETTVIVEEPPPPEGKARITKVTAPSEFTPNVVFSIYTILINDGGDDTLFFKLINRDTGKILVDIVNPHITKTGKTWSIHNMITLTQTTDFHGRVEAGHIE